MAINGEIFIGAAAVTALTAKFGGINPATAEPLEPLFGGAPMTSSTRRAHWLMPLSIGTARRRPTSSPISWRRFPPTSW